MGGEWNNIMGCLNLEVNREVGEKVGGKERIWTFATFIYNCIHFEVYVMRIHWKED